MDPIERIEARIVDVQSRFAQFAAAGAAGARPAARPAGTTTGTTTGTTSFQNVAAALGLSATDLAALTPASGGAVRSLRSAGSAKAPGTYGAVVLPAELAGQRNGALPDALLEPIGQGGHRLSRSAALAFRRMAAAAQQDGITLRVSDSYRSFADQDRLAGSLGLYREGGLAAVPGTSTHGWGLSVDLDVDARTQGWLRANASRFGFAEDVAREPWHYTFRPADC
jgi:D-alanyl-D-alanine carboxypeptidase